MGDVVWMVLGLLTIAAVISVFGEWLHVRRAERAVAPADPAALDPWALRATAAASVPDTFRKAGDTGQTSDASCAASLVIDLNGGDTAVFEQFKVRCEKNEDGPLTVVGLEGFCTLSAKTRRIRLGPSVSITGQDDGGRVWDFDSCGVALARVGGCDLPIRLGRRIDFEGMGLSQGGPVRLPVCRATVEAVLDYVDGEGAGTQRRVSIMGFEMWREGGEILEIYLHAWCHVRRDFRTFSLSRIEAVTDLGTGQPAADPVDWAWDKAGFRGHRTEKVRSD